MYIILGLCDLLRKFFSSEFIFHIKSVYEKVKYPSNLCAYKATQLGHLRTHIKSVHKKV